MSTDTPENAHDPTARRVNAGETEDERVVEDVGDGEPAVDDADDLVVVVCPQDTRERLRPELEEGRAQLYERYERKYEDLLAERAQLEDEVSCLERQLAHKEAQLDAVVARNERILSERTESFRREIADRRDETGTDGFQWTGRKRAPGLLARLKRWLP
ncbi:MULTISPECIES: hypothetical protein [Halorussus]|uniref:hypothetical protein n=1 Tax=Halorussus TaxID=1070314 RepID=UPI00209CA206|nr:hypothetical protein [Halorussus vallis]USZ74025.1 hypothetical protein NGM07_11215 [Halorussus vallis]